MRCGSVGDQEVPSPPQGLQGPLQGPCCHHRHPTAILPAMQQLSSALIRMNLTFREPSDSVGSSHPFFLVGVGTIGSSLTAGALGRWWRACFGISMRTMGCDFLVRIGVVVILCFGGYIDFFGVVYLRFGQEPARVNRALRLE